MQESFGVLAVVVTAFILFSIYFIFKLLQFVIVSVNLFKKMVKGQDAIIKILIDIRDQTKVINYKKTVLQLEEESDNDSLEAESKIENENDEDFNSLNNPARIGPPVYTTNEQFLEFCYHCGAELKKQVDACPKCGKKL